MAQVKLEEFQEPDRLKLTFLSTQHLPEPWVRYPEQLKARKIQFQSNDVTSNVRHESLHKSSLKSGVEEILVLSVLLWMKENYFQNSLDLRNFL